MPIPRISPANPNVTKFVKLKQDIAVSALLGDFKGYKKNSKILASEGVKDFESCKESAILSPQTISVRGMSTVEKLKMVKNIIKIKILNALRIKTPDEKLFNKMCKEEQLRSRMYNN